MYIHIYFKAHSNYVTPKTSYLLVRHYSITIHIFAKTFSNIHIAITMSYNYVHIEDAIS